MKQLRKRPFFENRKYTNNVVEKPGKSTEIIEENSANINNTHEFPIILIDTNNKVENPKRKTKINNDKISQKNKHSKSKTVNKNETFELGNSINQNKKNSPIQFPFYQDETLALLKSEKDDSETPKPKDANVKYKNDASHYDNLMIKSGEMFIESYTDLLNYRCDRYNLPSFYNIDFKELYGVGYESHKKFMELKLEDIFCFKSHHNKKIIYDMILNKKDLIIFSTLMNYTAEEAYDLYAKDCKYLSVGEAKFFVSHFNTITDSLNEKRKNEKDQNIMESLEKTAKNFVSNIYLEK